MANQNANQDQNQVFGMIAHSGTSGTAEMRKVAATDGQMWVKAFDNLSSKEFDNIAVAYPSGTTETYTYKLGVTSVGTITVSYLDAAKGSISTIVKS